MNRELWDKFHPTPDTWKDSLKSELNDLFLARAHTQDQLQKIERRIETAQKSLNRLSHATS